MRKKASRVRRYNVVCLIARTAALVVAVLWAWKGDLNGDLDAGFARFSPATVLWLALMGSMVARLLPSRVESLGCQKEFAAACRPTGNLPSRAEIRQADRKALGVASLWLGVNALFFIGYGLGWYDRRLMVCLAAFYGVCDIVCILFYCPFQDWIMHNRCCTTCRIYNWDYIMLCTPLFAIPSVYTATACALSIVVFLRWEYTCRRHPERFFESGNEALRCANCQEQLCYYKRCLSAGLKKRGAGGAD